MAKQGYRVRSKMRAGLADAISRTYIDCYKECYPQAIADSDVTFNGCMSACTDKKKAQRQATAQIRSVQAINPTPS